MTSSNIRRLLSRLSLFSLTFLTSRGRMCESMSLRVREDKVSMREAVAKSLSWLPMLSSCLAKESMSFPVTGLDIYEQDKTSKSVQICNSCWIHFTSSPIYYQMILVKLIISSSYVIYLVSKVLTCYCWLTIMGVSIRISHI